jgi:hypothetical protein
MVGEGPLYEAAAERACHHLILSLCGGWGLVSREGEQMGGKPLVRLAEVLGCATDLRVPNTD